MIVEGGVGGGGWAVTSLDDGADRDGVRLLCLYLPFSGHVPHCRSDAKYGKIQ